MRYLFYRAPSKLPAQVVVQTLADLEQVSTRLRPRPRSVSVARRVGGMMTSVGQQLLH